MEKSPVETLVEEFQCVICMDKVRGAHMCPHCSKLCCFTCIQRWLMDERSQCPHCRASLRLHELVNCRWVDKVTQQLDNLETAESTAKRTDHIVDRCKDHQRKLKVYCCTCCKFICHKCFGGDAHSGHSFKLLNEIYDEHVTRIKERKSLLQRRILKLRGLEQKVEETEQSVLAAKDERLREIDNSVKLMKARLDSQVTNKLATLTEQKNSVVQETCQVELLIEEMNLQLEECSKSELVDKSAELLNVMDQELSKPMASFVSAPDPVDFDSEIIPQYDSNTFNMNKFVALKAKGDSVCSPPFIVNGFYWCLKVYPDGIGGEKGNYLSVRLALSGGISGPWLEKKCKYECRVEMIHSSNSSKNIVQEFTQDFKVGDSWACDRFFRLDLLASEGFLDTINDTLVLRYHVRSPTFHQKSLYQQWYIQKLLKVQTNFRSRIHDLEERLARIEQSKNQGSSVAAPCQGNERGNRAMLKRSSAIMMNVKVTNAEEEPAKVPRTTNASRQRESAMVTTELP